MSQPIPLSKAKEVVKALREFGLYLTTVRDTKGGSQLHAVISGKHAFIADVDAKTVKQFYGLILDKNYKSGRKKNTWQSLNGS